MLLLLNAAAASKRTQARLMRGEAGLNGGLANVSQRRRLPATFFVSGDSDDWMAEDTERMQKRHRAKENDNEYREGGKVKVTAGGKIGHRGRERRITKTSKPK